MENLLQDLRVSLRGLAARPAFTMAAALTLALGVGSTTTVFSVVFGVLLRPLPFVQSDRLVALWQTALANPVPALEGAASPLNDEDWRRARTLDAVALYATRSVVLNEGEEPAVVPGAVVTPDFFRVLGRPLLLGREFTADEDLPSGPQAAIISEGLWKERFGSRPDVLGRTITIAGQPRPIVGVAPAGLDFPEGARIWLPVRNNDQNCGRGCVYLNGIGRLADGAMLAAAQQEIAAIARQLERDFPDSNTGVTFRAAGLQGAIVGDVQRPLYILLGAIFMVLLVACANVANLLLVRGSGRRAELAVRSTLGASRGRLLRQLLTESLVIAFMGSGLGLLFASWALSAVIGLSPGDLPRLNEVRLGLPSLVFTMGMTAVTTLTFGLVPALQLTRIPLARALRQGGRGETGPAHTLGRSLLLAGEVAFSVMLLIGAGLLVRSVLNIRNVQLGFEPEGVTQFTVSLPSARYESPERAVQFYHELHSELRGMPGLESVAFSVAPPLGPHEIVSSFERTDRPPPEPGQGTNMTMRVIDPQYAELLRIPIVAGRNFTEADRHGAQPVALITQAAADRFWRGENAVGKQIRLGVSFGWPIDDPVTIVGVLGDVRGTGLTTQPQPGVYIPQAQAGNGSTTVLLRARGDDSQLLSQARSRLRRLDPALPLIRPGPLADYVRTRAAAPLFYMTLLAAFAILAVALAAIGIYGVVAYLVAQRTREIGVRIALGARVSNVVNLVLWQGMRPALIGITAGLLGALASARVMSRLLYDVCTRDLVTFAVVPTLVAATVLLACVLPARRAGRTPPAIALRSEQL
jgi:predicted permease